MAQSNTIEMNDYVGNTNQAQSSNQRKADAFINLDVKVTDGTGVVHKLTAPKFPLYAGSKLVDAILRNPEGAAKGMEVTVRDIHIVTDEPIEFPE